MSFPRAVCAAPSDKTRFSRILAGVVLAVLAGLSLSCFSNHSPGNTTAAPGHTAYVSLPQTGNILLLNINGFNGSIIQGAQTPPVTGITPTGLALLPSRKFLYAINSFANTISTFAVASDGTLTLNGTPMPAESGPNAAVIDPSGKYLLVTNSLSNSVSVYSIDSASGALSEVGSPVTANSSPTNILITPSGKFVYVTNPGIGYVTGFTFSNGVLTPVPGATVFSGGGAAAAVVDASERFLYVANPSAVNPTGVQALGNVSGFNIDPTTGALTPILGSPFYPTVGTGPTAIAIDPTGRFVYAVAPGTGFSIWCFTITATSGQLVSVSNSPFSLASGGLFAAFDPAGGYFYIGSASGNGIEGYTYNQGTGALTVIGGSPFSTGTPPGKMVFSE